MFTLIGNDGNLAPDGLPPPHILLTGPLGVLSSLRALSEIHRKLGRFHLDLLWNLCCRVRVALAVDLIGFYFFCALSPVLMHFAQQIRAIAIR
ncbi:hypothetical protein EWW49_28425 [Pseudomonas syringae]|nr:hypothetical protein EWW49_28425 [Pseudomonas syringae]